MSATQMTYQTCTNRTKRPIRGTDGQRGKISFTAFYRSPAAPKFPVWETCMNQLYKFCRTAKLGTDMRQIIRLTMRYNVRQPDARQNLQESD